MRLPVQGSTHQQMPTKLNQADLNNNGDRDHQEENWIVEEVFEHIELINQELSAVDFVEDLHEHECVEEDGEVLSGL